MSLNSHAPLVGEYTGHSATCAPIPLNRLKGPTNGVVKDLPLRLNWTPRQQWDVADPRALQTLYSKLLTSVATQDELATLINGELLQKFWYEIRIPYGIRTKWEFENPSLRGTD